MILEIPYDVSYCDPSLQNKFRSRLSSLGDVLSFATNICLDELKRVKFYKSANLGIYKI